MLEPGEALKHAMLNKAPKTQVGRLEERWFKHYTILI